MGEATLRQGYLGDIVNAVIAAKLGSTDFDNMIEKIVKAERFFDLRKDEIGVLRARAGLVVIEGICARYHDSRDLDRILDKNDQVLRDVSSRIRESRALESRKLSESEWDEISSALNIILEDRIKTFSYRNDFIGLFRLAQFFKKIGVQTIEGRHIVAAFYLGRIGYKLGINLERKLIYRMVTSK